MADSVDEKRMRQALELAAKGIGLTRPNPPVGAVIVRNGRIVGSGYHRRAGGPHAEIVAIRKAGEKARGATLYVTLEPCSTHGRTPPCTRAVIDSGILRVVCAVRDPNPDHRGTGLRVLKRAGVEVVEGICADGASEILRPFAKWISTGRPFVTLKLAMTVDGRIADRTRSSKWITGAKARKRVQGLRKEVDAVMIGAQTALQDDPSLLYRHRPSTGPFRVAVDAVGRIPLSAGLFSDGYAGRTIIATTKKCPSGKRERIVAAGASTLVLPATRDGVSLSALMKKLGKMGLLHVLCEGGGEMAASLIKAGQVDRYIFFVAPRIMGGGDAIPAVGCRSWKLSNAPQLQFTSVENVGDDIMITAIPGRQ